jgi:hypothetical protein
MARYATPRVTLRAVILASLLVALTGVLLSRTADAEITPPVDRIHHVFPFEVGQQYQFKAGVDYYNRNGEVVAPADSVIEITITEVEVNGKTYLEIPYWTPFAWRIWARIDSGRVYLAATPVDVLLYDLNQGEFPADIRYRYNPNFWAYRDLDVDPHYCTVYWGCTAYPSYGWSEVGTDSVFRYVSYYSPSLNWGAEVLIGLYGDGSASHGSILESTGERRIWGLFRPKSNDPWPEFDEMIGPVGIKAPTDERPERADLSLSTFPNPFNPTVTIRYSVPSTGTVSLCIYDITGRFVRELAGSSLTAGVHTVVWNGSDETGRAVGSGVYIVRLRHDVQTASESAATCCGVAVQRITLVR